MRSTKGNAIAQYGIIIVLIALALIPILFMLGGTIVDQLTKFSQGLGYVQGTQPTSNTSPQYPLSTEPTIEPNSLGGTPENPVFKCSEGICQVDYGDFILAGIPENFGDFVESSGSSGGSNQLADLLDTLAEIAKNEDLPADDLALIKDLANVGHNLAAGEKSVEDLVHNLLTAENMSISDLVSKRFEYDDINQANAEAFYEKITLLQDKIANTTDPTTLSIFKTAETLANEINEIRKDTVIPYTNVYHDMDEMAGTGSYTAEQQELLAKRIVMDGSQRTDIKSTIICGTGKYSDDGKTCY